MAQEAYWKEDDGEGQGRDQHATDDSDEYWDGLNREQTGRIDSEYLHALRKRVKTAGMRLV